MHKYTLHIYQIYFSAEDVITYLCEASIVPLFFFTREKPTQPEKIYATPLLPEGDSNLSCARGYSLRTRYR